MHDQARLYSALQARAYSQFITVNNIAFHFGFRTIHVRGPSLGRKKGLAASGSLTAMPRACPEHSEAL